VSEPEVKAQTPAPPPPPGPAPPQPPQNTPYGYAQPPTQSYAQPSYGQQQPNVPAYQQPGYGPQQPQQPYPPQQPAYPPPYGQPPYPPQYVQQQPPPKKKSKWWIWLIVALVVVGLIVALILIFGGKKSGAEANDKLFYEGTLLHHIKEAGTDQIQQKSMGAQTDVSFALEGMGDDGMNELLHTLQSLHLRFTSKAQLDASKPRILFGIGAGRLDGDVIPLANIYTTKDHVVIASERLLEKPLALSRDMLYELMDGDIEFASVEELVGVLSHVQDAAIALNADQLEKIWLDVKEIALKHGGDKEKLDDVMLHVGTVFDEASGYRIVIDEAHSAEMLKEVLEYLKKQPDILKMLDEVNAMQLKLGEIDADENIKQDFIDELEDTIQDIEENPDDFRFTVTRELYSKGKTPVGGLIKIESDGDTVELGRTILADGNQVVSEMYLNTPDGEGIKITSNYTKDKNAFTGTSDVTLNVDELMHATFAYTNFGLVELNGQYVPVGKVAVTFDDEDNDYVTLTYQGQIQGDALQGSIYVGDLVTDDLGDMEDLGLRINITYKPLKKGDLKFDDAPPKDAHPIDTFDDLEEAVDIDQLFENLMGVLEDLGIDSDVLAEIG
jgi:hypothetical protein